MCGCGKPSPYDLAAIKQSFEQRGLTLIEGTAADNDSFGVEHEGFRPTLVDINDFFVRFQCMFRLSHQKVCEDRTGVLGFVNELNIELSLAKVTLCQDNSNVESDLHVVTILPALFDSEVLVGVYEVWQENLCRLVVHKGYSVYGEDDKDGG